MTKGVFISAFGRRGYGFAAWNLAFSIKKFSPEIPVALFCQQETINQISPDKMNVFDELITIPDELLYPFDPCRIKINVYDYLPYDITLVLDADSLALKDIAPCFDEFEKSGRHHATHIYKTHTLDKGRDFPEMWWAWMDDVWTQYQLKEDAVFPATNSSWQFVRKSDEAEKLFSRIKENYKNPVPIEKLKNKWGGTQPDELYLNIAMAQEGFQQYNPIMFFGSQIDKRDPRQLVEDYYFLSIFGGRKTTKDIYIQWYDKLMFSYCRQNIPQIAHQFKVNYINADKHMNNPLKLPRSERLNGNHGTVNLQKAVIPISETKVIDSKLLADGFKGMAGQHIKATNWFNCSIAEFKGKYYLAYRLERPPFCARIRIGMCELNDNFIPIAHTNKILNLHSKLAGFADNYHVEDPRLFVFNNGLYISYTDGYQMAQAKINPETFEVSENFYIQKPNPARTEKNWTFFEYDGRIYSVYNTSPHVIFEMDDNSWTEKYRTKFDHNWKWGEIRGGTSPLRIGDKFISFFHSALDITRNGSKGKQYFAGAYMFEAEPPFNVVAISKEPLLAGEFISEAIPRLWNKIFVVFPNGAVRKDDKYIVSFGYNDYQCRLAEISDELLKENLIELKHDNQLA